MPKVEVNGVKLHYITVGRGSDVVMVHGFLGNLAVWHLHMVPELRRQWRLTTYDLRGHGNSQVTADGYSAENLAGDLAGLIEALNLQRPVLIGHSLGADICLNYALLHPRRARKIVAIEPGLAALVEERKSPQWVGWKYWVAKLQEVGIEVPADKRSDPYYLLDLSLNTPKFYGPARGLPRKRGPLLRLIHETSLLEDYEKVGSLTMEAIREIRTETLLIYGENSHFLSTFEHMKEALPNCKPVLLPGGEHFGPLEQPELLTEHIRAFLGATD